METMGTAAIFPLNSAFLFKMSTLIIIRRARPLLLEIVPNTGSGLLMIFPAYAVQAPADYGTGLPDTFHFTGRLPVAYVLQPFNIQD
jgi:hypothetical protein